MTGRTVKVISDDQAPKGVSKLFLDASDLAPGAYSVNLQSEGKTYSKRLMVK